MLTSPKRKPQEFGFKAGDTHVVVSAITNKAKIFNYSGQLLHTIPAMPMGQKAQWWLNGGDTPPGLYKLGAVYNDYSQVGKNPSFDRTLMSYGWVTFDMIDLEGHEDGNGRAGICWHGGGSGCGWPGAWAAYQPLYPTLGCVRSHNAHLIDVVLPLVKQGTVYVSVHQDDK